MCVFETVRELMSGGKASKCKGSEINLLNETDTCRKLVGATEEKNPNRLREIDVRDETYVMFCCFRRPFAREDV